MSLVPASCPIGTTWREWDLLTLSRHSPPDAPDLGRNPDECLVGLRLAADLSMPHTRTEHAVDDRREAVHVHGDAEVDGLRVHVDWVWVRAWGPGRSLAEVRVFVDGRLTARAVSGGCSLGAGSNTFPAVASIGPRLALVVPKASESGAPAAVQVWRA